MARRVAGPNPAIKEQLLKHRAEIVKLAEQLQSDYLAEAIARMDRLLEKLDADQIRRVKRVERAMERFVNG